MTWTKLFVVTLSMIAVEANNIEYLADHLLVHWQVDQNPCHVLDYMKYSGVLTLTNGGPDDAYGNDWEIYFCSIRLMYPDQLRGHGPDFGHLVGDTNILVFHLNGCMHKLKPTAEFEGFQSEVAIRLPFEAGDWSVSRTDVMPRWFVANTQGSEVKTIASTSHEELDFVADFDTEMKWKRATSEDQYDPLTPEMRFDRNAAIDIEEPKKRIIPTPFKANFDDSETVEIILGEWVIVYSSEEVKNEADFLAAAWETASVDMQERPSNRYVQINTGDVEIPGAESDEAYQLSVIPEESVINITGRTAAGAFYGIQSLLSLFSYSRKIPRAKISDYPRFPYRGMHIDVGRNFRPKEDIFKLLEVMAMYKLNNLYFHLTEDEGWRLEINGLPELTTIGGRRCFDLDKECIMSQLGSGPTPYTSGSGYYTAEDYKEILKYANERHIRITPQFNMPGHIHAAVKSMEARYKKLNDSEYLLTDFNDSSQYLTTQLFRDNTANPCITSSYNFVRKIIQEVKALHKDIQPLKAFNFGGDEVSGDAWVNSTACDDLIADNPELEHDEFTPKNTMLHRYFVGNVSEIAHKHGLDIAAWEDGMLFNKTPIDRGYIPNDNAFVFAWSNIWESGTGNRAYKFANDGYKVVISHATHFYFDHPHEPDPEERGFYWATRYTDTAKTFGYYADDIYENIGVTLMGEPINREELCEEFTCDELEEDKRENIIGLQGQLFSETVRTSEQLDSMIYPRMLALAERAWHKAPWEDISSCGEQCDSIKATDWTEFANSLGYKELKRLDDVGVNYHIAPPGARIAEEDGTYRLEVNVEFPGQQVVYSTDNLDTWQTRGRASPVTLEADQQIHIHVRSVDLGRSGRSVTLQTGRPVSGDCRLSGTLSLLVVNLLLALCTKTHIQWDS